VTRVQVEGRAYTVLEPVGDAALDMYGLAMEAMEERGAMAALFAAAGADGAESDRQATRAARLLAASPTGRRAARLVLRGATVDGAALTPELYVQWYTQSGRMLEPYIATLLVWSRLGFFSVASASTPEEPATPAEEPAQSGVV